MMITTSFHTLPKPVLSLLIMKNYQIISNNSSDPSFVQVEHSITNLMAQVTVLCYVHPQSGVKLQVTIDLYHSWI